MADHTKETIGCDVGDKTSKLFLLGPDGQVTRPKAVKTTREGLTEFFRRAPAMVVIEAGAHSRWIAQLLKELGHQVVVGNPRRLKLISQNDSKSDELDAELLARLGRADVKLLSPIEHRSEEAQADLAVAKARDALVSMRTRLVNHIRGTAKSFGFRFARCTAESFARLMKDKIPDPLRPALEPIVRVLEQLEKDIRGYDKALERIAKKYPDVEMIAQPNGVGLLTALVFLLTLEDKERFKKSRTVGSYVGLRPRKDQSGDDERQLGITKAGDPFLRRLLVNSANYVLGPFGSDSDLRRWGLKLCERGGKNARKRAKVAVARKQAVLMHRLWVTGEVYEPLGYLEKRNAARKAA